jgi:hypothetical protein
VSHQTPSDGNATTGSSLVGRPAREVPAAPPEGPTTDCPTCFRTAKDCGDSKAKGWDNCCLTCDQNGHVEQHRLRMSEPRR